MTFKISVGYDIAIRSGDLVSKDLETIARNYLLLIEFGLCSPKYLANRSEIETPSDLVNHRIN
ncbi:hypothetical protein O9993_08775 [Vibrio lentus]|nr:hypothetical protein [Vibrio lentus]